jgi:hypothetical protein
VITKFSVLHVGQIELDDVGAAVTILNTPRGYTPTG